MKSVMFKFDAHIIPSGVQPYESMFGSFKRAARQNAMANGIMCNDSTLFVGLILSNEKSNDFSIGLMDGDCAIHPLSMYFPLDFVKKFKEGKIINVNIPCSFSEIGGTKYTKVVRCEVEPAQLKHSLRSFGPFEKVIYDLTPSEDIFRDMIEGEKTIYGEFYILPRQPYRMGSAPQTYAVSHSLEELCTYFKVNHYGLANTVIISIDSCTDFNSGISDNENRYRRIVPASSFLPMDALKIINRGSYLDVNLPCVVKDYTRETEEFISVPMRLKRR